MAEGGAVFQLYLKSAGSYDNAADSVRDILTTDSNGLATSKDMPYGNYVLHQIGGEENCTFMNDMEVSITENGRTYELTGNDAQKYSKIRLYKKGEVLTGFNQETGFTYEEGYVGGCTYVVYSDPSFSDESLVEQITTVDGTYAESRYEYEPGTYYIKEVSTNGKYLLDPEVHEITVTADTYAEVGVTNVTMEDPYSPYQRRLSTREPSIYFFNDTATTEIYTLSLHDALPIYSEYTLQRILRTEAERLLLLRELFWKR